MTDASPGPQRAPDAGLRRRRWLLIIGGVLVLGMVLATARHLFGGSPMLTEPSSGTRSSSASSGPSSSGRAGQVRCLPSQDPVDPLSATGESLFLSLIASAENSSLRWEDQVGYIEYNVEGNSSENRGYTGGIVGFTSKTHDMLQLVRAYAKLAPDNPLAGYVDALTEVDGSSDTEGLGQPFVRAWKRAASDPKFRQAQLDLARSQYIQPAVALAKQDKVGVLGQFAYVDAAVMHGTDASGLGKIRQDALGKAKPPAQGGAEKDYLGAFLDARVAAMKREKGHKETSRVDTMQRAFLGAGNLSLTLPLEWKTYGDTYDLYSQDECARRGISG